MKNKFSTIDLYAVLHELQNFVGMRVTNVYDIDSRTYLLKLQKPEHKAIILFESGNRIHYTSHEWPKSQIPSQFSMKFRKHINQKRLISIRQLGVDRIVDMQFGEEDRACHVIVELYDRGNIVLTDDKYVILNILRPRTDKDSDVRFTVRERYPIDAARQETFLPSKETIGLFLANAKKGDVLRKALIKNVPFSSALLDHALIAAGLPVDAKIGVTLDASPESVAKVQEVLAIAEEIQEKLRKEPGSGYITYEARTNPDGSESETYHEYHPFNFAQFSLPNSRFRVHEFETFSEAVDRYYSLLDEQKVEQRALAQEAQAIRKFENVKKDHEMRVKQLDEIQSIHVAKAERIEANRELVDQALLLVRTAIASKMAWNDVKEWLAALTDKGVAAAELIVRMDLHSNEVTLSLANPYDPDAEHLTVDIDIDLSASQNSRKYFSDKKNAAEKQKKTIHASSKALKNVQMNTKNKISQVRAATAQMKARKTNWFERFYWFISSDGLLVIGGRDFQQNEQLVKRYLRVGDIYVHADIHGACSVVVRNRSREAEIPPRTINEAGTFAICYSSAWEAKIVINAWWVRHDQVSRTAPTGEYLSAGAFMIRGKKNYIPSNQLQLGFGILFRLDDESTEKHRALDAAAAVNSMSLAASEVASEAPVEAEEEDVELEAEKGDEGEENDGEGEGDEEEEEEDEESAFPDIELKRPAQMSVEGDETEYTMLQFVPQQKVKKIDQREQYLEEKRRKEQAEAEEKKKVPLQAQKGPLTKRQKHKMEKIKKKYKDQDEEERALRMELLGHKKQEETPAPLPRKLPPRPAQNPQQQQAQKAPEEQQPDEDDDAEDPEETLADADAQVIEQLCARPLHDDAMVYAVAMCGPYAAMQKFKYRVKVTPGSGKRGKGAKTALQLFVRDRTASPAEVNLIKGLMSDDHIASNIPTHVRISAPQLLKMKK